MSDLIDGSSEVARGPLVPVDDPDDPRLDEYRHLNDPAGRRQIEADRAIFVVEGKLAVDRLLSSRVEVLSVLVDDRQVTSAASLVDAARSQGAPVYVGTRHVVEATVGFALHRGVVAIARRPDPEDPSQVLGAAVRTSAAAGGPALVVVLEGLNDHENIGALFRNAAAFGVAAVLLDPTSADPLYRRSVRVSMGHVLHVPFARLEPWPSSLDLLRNAGFLVVALAPHSNHPATPSVSLADVAKHEVVTARAPTEGAGVGGSAGPTGVALVVGAEGPGLTEGTLAAADLIAAIPMASEVDSLNVATAAAVAFHALKQG